MVYEYKPMPHIWCKYTINKWELMHLKKIDTFLQFSIGEFNF